MAFSVVHKGSGVPLWRTWPLELAAAFLAYFVAGKLGQATGNIRSNNLGPVWPAYGIALAAFLSYGYRVWPAIFASAFLVAIQGGVPAIGAAGQAGAATTSVALSTFMMRRIPEFHPRLSSLRDALGLIVYGAFGGALVSSSLGTASLYGTGIQPYSGLGSSWLIYWLGDSTGALLVTPLVLSAPQLLTIRSCQKITEAVVLVTLLVLACVAVFGDIFPIHLHPLAFAVLPFVMWGAIDFGIAGASVTVFIIATIATVITAFGSGPFAEYTPFVNATLLDVLFGVLAVSGLTLAAVIAERQRAESERETLIREQALTAARGQMLAAVNRRLIEAQEQERARIARELHDDISQQLAMLVWKLTNEGDDIRNRALQIAADLQNLSRELHPSRIELTGLATGLGTFCREFAAQKHVSVDYQATALLDALPSNISLTLFRVAQEALRNSAKHSGVRECQVRLWSAESWVHLTVTDRGAGFDVNDSEFAARGIGLVTMRERMNLVEGQLSIESGRGAGTAIHARAPFRALRPLAEHPELSFSN